MYGTQFAQIIPPRALDSDQSHFLHHLAGSDLTANRDVTWLTGDADRLATLQGDPLLDDWFDQSVKTSASPTFAGLVLSGVGGVLKASAGVVSGSAGFSDLSPATADIDMGAFKFTARQLESDVPGGTPPLVVASTEVIANLNADLLDGQHATAFLADITGENLGDLADVDTVGLATGDFLQYDGVNWVDFDLFGSNNTWTGTNQFNSLVQFGDSSHYITDNVFDLLYRVPTGGSHVFRVSTVAEMTILANEVQFNQPGLPSHTVGFKFAIDNNLDVDIDGTRQVTFTDGTLEPVITNDIDLGTSTKEFKDAFFAGVVRMQMLRVDGSVGGLSSTVTITNKTSQTTATTVTVGKIAGKGETGPGTTAQWGWLKIFDGVTSAYLPIWR